MPVLSNAVKFTPGNGTVRIDASVTGTGRHEKNFLEVAVTDNGSGVPGDQEKYLFDKYVQLEDKLQAKGTGLGLAVSKLIVDAHGGSIGYRPVENGTGSIFYFRLSRGERKGVER